MKQNNHRAIYGSDSEALTLIANLLKGIPTDPFFQDLKGKKGALFSTKTLNHYIKEEAIHDDDTLTHNDHRSIRTFSSGEQKKKLLTHLLSLKPDFLVLDNLFDMLDKASKKRLLHTLEDISYKTTLIQIFRRNDEILPFIDNVLRLMNDNTFFSGTVKDYRSQFRERPLFSLSGSIPPALFQPEASGDPIIQFKNVCVTYDGNPVLKNICWEINRGDFWQLIGPNGSGKTTLLTMITGNNPKAYGQDLTLFGMKKGSGESIWDIKKQIGYVTPAMTVLFNGSHTVENMVVSGLYDSIGQYRKPTPLEIRLANQWLDLIGLSGMKRRWFSDLPEEQRCMVLIARSMIKHPLLLILDEPTHGLNDEHVSMVTTLINKIAEETKTAIIYVSHREEDGLLKPGYTYELTPGKKGSEGIVRRPG